MPQLGKYSTDRDNILHFMCTSGWGTGEFGNVEAPTGYVWKISNKEAEVQVANTEVTSLIEDQIAAYDIADGKDFRKELEGHFLIVEDSNGLVSVEPYPSEFLLDKAFHKLEGEFFEWDSQDGDENL